MRAAIVAIIIAASTPARAQPTDHSREVDTAIFVGGGITYLGVEFGLKHYIVRPCVWCEPPGFDLAARNALVWDNHAKLAGITSTVSGYAAAPMLASGLLVAATWDQRGGRRFFDDTIPVFEAAIAVGLLHHVTKFSFPRRRPFVKFTSPDRPPDDDDNASLFSGHTALAFAVTVAGGIVADKRGYAVEPYIWTGGFALAALTGYLRIAADKHWLSDVLLGAAIGTGLGLVTPYLHRDSFDRSSGVAMPLLGYAGVL
jgi:membrane-associated phospholipid phosphatase